MPQTQHGHVINIGAIYLLLADPAIFLSLYGVEKQLFYFIFFHTNLVLATTNTKKKELFPLMLSFGSYVRVNFSGMPFYLYS